MPVQMRLPHTRHSYLVGRYLDMGLAGVLVPETVEVATVEEAIAFAYYPQVGKRSVSRGDQATTLRLSPAPRA